MKRLVLALLATTCLTAPVQAEPISTAIGLTAVIAGTGLSTAVAGAIGGAVISGVVAAGISVAASTLAKGNQPSEGAAAEKGGTSLSVQYGAGLPRSARMGPGATGGHHVYTNVYGAAPFENMFLQCVFVIGDGQHGKCTRVRYNGKDCTLPTDLGPGGWSVPEFVQAGNPRVILRYFRGRYDQAADGDLITNSNPPGRWTADHRGAGVCYLSVTQVYDEELGLTGIPSVLVETEGLVLYDPRKDSTNGGSGAHRWGLTDTYEPSANPAVQEYNFRRGIYCNGQRLLGMTISPVNLLLAMYHAAANINDEPIPLAGGGSESRYRCSIEVNDARSNADVLGAIRGATAGWSLERGGQFGPVPGVPQIPVASLAFTDDDLIVGERATFTKYRSRTEIVTAAHGSFSDPMQYWASAAFPPRVDPTSDAYIGERIARDFDLTQVYSSSQAQRIAESERRRTLQEGQGTVTLPAKWIGVQPGDWLTYNSQRHGSMTILITGAQLDTVRHLVTLTYERTSNSVYSWTTAGELFPPDVGAGGIPGFITMIAEGMVATGINIPGDGGLVTPGIHFAWTPIMDPSVDQIDFEIRKVGDTAILPFTADFPSSGSAVCSHGIQAATNYEYRHKLYTTPYRDTPWSAWATVMSGTQHIVPTAFSSIPGDVTLASFEQGLRDYVGKQLSASMAEVDRIEQMIANEAAEQDAHNFLERKLAKEGDVRLREQVSAQFGFVWRGTWDEFTQYHDGDQVRHEDVMYWTTEDVITTPPPNDPWEILVSSAMIAENWMTFAGTDGAAASTSNMIEARFKGTFEGVNSDLQDGQSVATALSVIKAFAGADYAVAATSDQIEARFKGGPVNGTPNDMTTSVANLITQWSVYAGPDLAVAKSESEVLASINGNTASITTNSTAIANINGALAAAWTVTLDVNGFVSGLKLYNTGTTSNFTIITDSFLIAKPGAAGPTPVFALGTSNGTGKLILRGDMIADGTITANAIVAGSIQAIHVGTNQIIAHAANIANLVVDNIKIADGAVTNFGAASAGDNVTIDSFSFFQVLATSVTARGVAGKTIFVYVTGTALIAAVTPSGCVALWRVLIDGVEVMQQNLNFPPLGSATQEHCVPIAVGREVAATGGSQTIPVTLEVRKLSGVTVGELHIVVRRMCAQSFAR